MRVSRRVTSSTTRSRFAADRARIKSPNDRPTTPFSSNVTPFDYACPVAQEIVRARNAGTDSRSARTKLDIRSQGVIFRGLLWFWNINFCGYYLGIPWTKEHGRPALHRVLWEETHGPIPAGHVVSYIDKNPNNLDPANLYLRSRDTVCRENQAAAITRKSREITALLLKRSQTKNSHDLIDHLTTR